MPPSSILAGHSNPHVNCPLCNAARDRRISAEDFASLPVCEAAPIWLQEHALELGSEKSVGNYQYYLRAVVQFFGPMILRDIHAGHLEKYQEWRQTPWTDEHGRTWKAGASAINHELNTLAQILQRGSLWREQKIACEYKPLKQPKSRAGKALKDENAERWLFDVAATNSRWKVAYWTSLLMANTGAGPNEIRHLRLEDIHLGEETPYIHIREGIKNDYRDRAIPLNASAQWAVKQIVKRARKLGASDPEHFALPHRAHKRGEGWDFTRPMGSWKRAWWALRAKAGMEELRLYDLRHHTLTKLYESPETSEETATEIAGHEDVKMRRHYSHIRLKVKSKALASIEVKPGPTQLELRFAGEPQPGDKLPPAAEKLLEFHPQAVGARKK